MSPRTIILLAAVALFLGVAAGAFGAHALRSRISPELLAVFQTGVQYHLVHALGLLAVGVAARSWPQIAGRLGLVAVLLVVGVVLFSGSLYALALTDVRGFGTLTPFGGAAWLIAWGLLAWTALRHIH